MRDALVFNGFCNLDFQEIRSNVIRIPEVVQRIRQAQSIWDRNSSQSLDLATFLGSEDAVFLGHIRLKDFATAVVQVGLLDRFLRKNRLPEFVVGASNGDSPLKVATGQISFDEMVLNSPALTNFGTRPLKPNTQGSMELPILTGVQLVEYAVIQVTGEGAKPVPMNCRDLEKMVVDLVENHDVQRLIMVGPGHSIFGRRMMELTSRDVQVAESIELDPMLAWFWSNLNECRLAVAN